MNVVFSEHLALLREFLDRRQEIVEHIEHRLLNVREKDTPDSRNRREFEQTLDSCFFKLPGLPRGLLRLKGQLAAMHLADGFEPISLGGYSYELDPLELIVRARQYWERHRWPGRSIRLRFASNVYSVFVLRQLEHLSLRIWDDGNEGAEDRLQEIQSLLDRLNAIAGVDPLVRDARWLIQTAQGPLTRRLQPYFRITERISESFSDARRLEVHKAGARLTSGHLRSQLRYRSSETGQPVDNPEVLAITRNSNSLDAALLVRDLVPLLQAYGTACNGHGHGLEERLDLADAIFQGLSADPELFLTRLDLLGPCTMIEDLFLHCGEDGHPRFTPRGETHRRLLESYRELIAHHAESLQKDALALDPRLSVYSPLGISYGFCADILSNMTLDTLVAQPSFGLALEDMFVSRGSLENKHARAEGWKTLPQREGEREHFEHSADGAAQMFARTTSGLRARAECRDRANASDVANARLFVVPDAGVNDAVSARLLADGIVLAQEHCVTSDLHRALATGATAFPRGRIVNDRNEGRFLASAESAGTWFGVSKVVLTLCTSQGRDALLTGVPPAVVDLLQVTCPGLVVVA
jgi:hypothetical protein